MSLEMHLIFLVLVWLLFEVSEIEEHSSTHNQSLIFSSGTSGEVASEVISSRQHSLSASWASLLKGGNNFTRGRLDIEINSFTAFKRTLAMHTDLETTGFNDIFQVVVLVIKFIDNVEASPDILDLSNVLILAIFDVVNHHFRSVEAVESTLAWSVNIQEWFVVKLFSVIFKIDLDLERLAIRGHTLLGTEAGFFLGLEEFLSLLFTILAQWENIVGVVLITTSEGFSKIELLLDEDTVSGGESFVTLLWLLDWGSHLLRRILRRVLGRVLGRVLSRRVLLRRILLRRILLGRVLLRRILLGRVLLRRISTLLRVTRTELNSDSGLLRLLHFS
jgi:hypothetical protein